MRYKTPLLLFFTTACLVYANTIPNDLVYDDLAVIPDQEVIRDPWALGAIFGGRYFGDLAEQDPLYRPLTVWSLALTYGLNKGLGLPGDHPQARLAGDAVLPVCEQRAQGMSIDQLGELQLERRRRTAVEDHLQAVETFGAPRRRDSNQARDASEYAAPVRQPGIGPPRDAELAQGLVVVADQCSPDALTTARREAHRDEESQIDTGIAAPRSRPVEHHDRRLAA